MRAGAKCAERGVCKARLCSDRHEIFDIMTMKRLK